MQKCKNRVKIVKKKTVQKQDGTTRKIHKIK